MAEKVLAIDRSPDPVAKYYAPIYLSLADISKRVNLQVAASINDKRYGFKHPSKWYPRNRFEEYCYRNLCLELDVVTNYFIEDWFDIAMSRVMRISKHNLKGE